MMSLPIDFAPPSFKRALSRLTIVSRLLGGLGIVLCAATGIRAWDGFIKVHAAQAAYAAMHAKTTLYSRQQKPSHVMSIRPAQANAVNRATAQLNLPWRDLFDAIEAATPENVAVLALEPNAKLHLLRGTAQVNSSTAMVDYIAQLKRQPLFDNVVLLKHEIIEQDANKPVRFQFEAIWLGALP